MNWPAYQSYKESGVPWLSPIPTHWNIGPVKRFLRSLDNIRVPLSTVERGTRQGEYPYYGASGVIDYVDDYLFDQDNVLVSEDGANLLGRRTPIAFVARGRYWVNNHAHILRPIEDESPDFWAHRVESESVAPLVTGAAQPKLTIEALMNLLITAPPTVEERCVIVDFVKRETAKIDALIAKQEQLIATLREDRTATIDSAFPMEGELTRLKAVLHFAQTGPFGTQLAAEEYIADGIPVINPTHIQDNKIIPDIGITVSADKADDLARHRFRTGDIVLGRKGEVDKSALVDTKAAGFICGSDAILLRPRLDVIVPAYLWWFFQSPRAHSQLEQWSVGSTVAGLNQTTMRKIYLPHPSIDLQRQIVARLQAQTAKVDALIAKATQVIETLHEYQSALITDAVTGKIDVREAA